MISTSCVVVLCLLESKSCTQATSIIFTYVLKIYAEYAEDMSYY